MIYEPASEDELVACVREARDRRRTLRLVGGGTRTQLGRPLATDATLSLAKMGGVRFYAPDDMVICARAGAPLAEIEDVIAARNQMLPFAPMDHRRLFRSAGAPTIGAVAACNLSGARRIAHGAARDSLIGVRFVNGLGQVIKSGGRVMKNVTGLDLVKLQAGAFGCLGPLSEVTFKLAPKPERAATLVLYDLDDARAIATLSQALGSPFEVSGAAHTPAGVMGARARTWMRIENFSDSVAYRIAALQDCVGAGAVLDDAETAAVWRDLADAAFFANDDRAVWRVSTAPSRAVDFVRRVSAHGPVAHAYDWGGGLVWLAVAPEGDALAAVIRAALAAVGGHATVQRAPDALRVRLDVFQPLSAPVMALHRAIKRAVDPDRLFNPGLMYADV